MREENQLSNETIADVFQQTFQKVTKEQSFIQEHLDKVGKQKLKEQKAIVLDELGIERMM